MAESEDVKKAEIDRLYKENVSKVYRTALYYVEDHYVAEEIVQEVFLKLYDNLGDICMESVPAWLITTAKNMAKNYLRDSKWETPMEEVPEQEVPYSSEGLDAQLIEVLRQKECRELHDTIFADLYEKNSRWYEAVTVSYTLDKPQKEVAEKFAAVPKTKEFTSLAILAQSIGSAELLFDVDPTSFDPQPKVVSSILKIDKQKEFVEGSFSGIFENKEQLQSFKKYLRSSFQSPRKTWLKNISSEFDKQSVKNLMQMHNLPETIRPHEISVLSHHLLFKYLRLNDARKREQTEPNSAS